MDEKRKLRVLDRLEEELKQGTEQKVSPKVSHPNQSNPIYNKLAKFTNEKIGQKLSIKDLLR